MLVRGHRGPLTDRLARVIALTLVTAGAVPTFAAAAQQPAAQTAQRPNIHVVKPGETLASIAQAVLGDGELWPAIYRLNTDKIQDPHWIYPGEVLRIPAPQSRVVGITPPEAAPRRPEAPPERPIAKPTVEPPAPPPPPPPPAPRAVVPTGEFLASPWVDQRGGPKDAGSIIENRDVPGIASVDRSRMTLYDDVDLTLPATAPVAPHTLYLSYRKGPLIEGFGQVIVPTGVIEITHPPENGEAAIGRVVRMFSDIRQGEQVIPLDSSAALATSMPSATASGPTGSVRWIDNAAVEPSLQRYVIIDLSGRDGAATGDEVEFYQPRHNISDSNLPAIPETPLGRARVLRVTPYGASAIVTSLEQPKLEEGTAVRITAKMP